MPSSKGSGSAAIDPRAPKDVFGDDDATFREILGDFVEPAGKNVEEIGLATQAGDNAAVGAASHKLKSSARAVGANELAYLCAELEIAGKAGDDAKVAELAPNLPAAMGRVTEFIEAL